MTFSQADVVKLVNEKFVAAWESVAPVRVATFDLGAGKSIKGTVGGEIAIYFCRPDGKVFDILPALQSPQVTYWAIKNALEFYRRTQASDEAIRDYHSHLLAAMEKSGAGELNPQIEKSKKDLAVRKTTWDPGTHDMGRMAYSKTGIMKGGESVVVIEPGGLDYYRKQIHALLASTPIKTPAEWKELIFVQVLEQELKGGNVKYDVNTLAPFSIIEED